MTWLDIGLSPNILFLFTNLEVVRFRWGFFNEYQWCVVGIYLGLWRFSSATVSAIVSLSGGVFISLKGREPLKVSSGITFPILLSFARPCTARTK